MALGLKPGLNCPGNGSGIEAWACPVQRLCTNSPWKGEGNDVPFPGSPSSWDVLCVPGRLAAQVGRG